MIQSERRVSPATSVDGALDIRRQGILPAARRLMVPVGLAGPLVMPPMTGLLLNSVPGHLAGTVSGVFNTSRQAGGALAVALFGALLANGSTFMQGLRASLLTAAGVALVAAAASLLLPRLRRREST